MPLIVRKLNIGSGWNYREGYINTDLWQRGNRLDIVCRAEALPFKNGVFNEVYSCHVLEHISYWLTKKVLTEWVRVLSVGGEIVVSTIFCKFV